MSSATYGTDQQAPLWEIPSFEESNKAFELIDEGFYIVQLANVEEPVKVLPKYDPSGKKYRAKFIFEVVSDVTGNEDWAGTKVSMYYTLTMNEKSNLYPVAKALLGGQIDPAQRVTPTMLLGKQMQCMIAHGEPNDNGDVWPVIKSPAAVKGSRRTTTQDVAQMMDAEPEILNDVPF